MNKPHKIPLDQQSWDHQMSMRLMIHWAMLADIPRLFHVISQMPSHFRFDWGTCPQENRVAMRWGIKHPMKSPDIGKAVEKIMKLEWKLRLENTSLHSKCGKLTSLELPRISLYETREKNEFSMQKKVIFNHRNQFFFCCRVSEREKRAIWMERDASYGDGFCGEKQTQTNYLLFLTTQSSLSLWH